MASIFVQIPSYRDHELPATVCDALAKMSYQHDISFGIHNCQLPGDDIHMACASHGSKGHGAAEICMHTSTAPDNLGLQRSRLIANGFYRGEDYYLQLDAHMRFVRDWDAKLVDMHQHYKRLGIAKPLISMYPPAYTLDINGQAVLQPNETFYATRISFAEFPDKFTDTLIPSQQATASPEGCVYTSSVSGGFIFTDGSFAEITPNPLIAFWGEEILIAARAFTSGFDLVTATEDTVFHLYHSGQPFELTRRHHVWNDFPAEFAAMDTNSKAEIQRIFSDRVIGDGALGTVRTLDQFEEFAGLDFMSRQVTQVWC